MSTKKRPAKASTSPLDTIITQYVKCDVSDKGRHKVRAAIRADGHLAHLECECDQEMSDSIVRLGGASCYQLVTKMREGLSSKTPYYNVKLPGALSGLSEAISKATKQAAARKSHAERDQKVKRENTIKDLGTRWARKASGLNMIRLDQETGGNRLFLTYSNSTARLAVFNEGRWSIDAVGVRDFSEGHRSMGEQKCPVCGTDVHTDGKKDRHVTKPRHHTLIMEAVRRAVALLTPGSFSGGPSPSRVYHRPIAWKAAWYRANNKGGK